MKKICLALVVNGVCLYVVSQLIPGVMIPNDSLIALTIIFSLLNVTVKPILKLLSFPITILTLGVFLVIINAAILRLAFYFSGTASVNGFWNSILAAVVISILNSVLNSLFDSD